MARINTALPVPSASVTTFKQCLEWMAYTYKLPAAKNIERFLGLSPRQLWLAGS
jgi:hypothetical protein